MKTKTANELVEFIEEEIRRLISNKYRAEHDLFQIVANASEAIIQNQRALLGLKTAMLDTTKGSDTRLDQLVAIMNDSIDQKNTLK